MSVSSQTAKSGPFLITALPQVIPIGFPVQQSSDILVLDYGPTGSAYDPALVLVLGSDYTFTGGGYNASNEMQTGSITVVSTGISAVAVNDNLVIMRNVPINQTTSFQALGPLTIQQVEQALDKGATIDQQLQEQATRSLRFENFEFLDGTLYKDLRSGNLLGFDTSGQVVYYSPTSIGTGGVLGAGYGITLSGSVVAVDRTLIGAYVNTIALLKAIVVTTTPNTFQVMVAGYYTAGDGGGGLFTYSSGSVATDNGGTIIQPNAGGGRWLRSIPNTQVNVRQFGAKGDGATNDTTAIAAAKTLAVANAGSSLYFPPGTYITDTISVVSATGLTISGAGKGVTTIKGRTATQVLNVSASTYINVFGLTFNGNCTVRTAGQQAVILDASNSSFCDNEIINSGEFAFMAGSGATIITDLIVSRNKIGLNYADGINLQNVQRALVESNVIDGPDDDCIAVGYNGSGVATHIKVMGNFCRARADLGTTTGRGIWVGRAMSVDITGNYIFTIKQDGILITNEGGARPTDINVIGNVVNNAATASGHSITAYATTNCSLIDNVSHDPGHGNLIEIADWQNLTIKGGTLSQSVNVFARGIHCDESPGWAATWSNIKISGVTINMLGASTAACVYLSPDASVTMAVGIISGILGQQVAGGDYIFVAIARGGTLWKIVNNVQANAATTITPATAGVFTTTQNT